MLKEARLCREEAGGGKWRRQRHPRRHQPPPNYTSREPIDLSTRKIRGSPPSYLQTMQAKQAASALTRIESGGVCDPMIDEHFRRSLGKDYLSNSSPQSDDKSDSSGRLEDSSSLSVDDHFAKALGDTWVKLQEEERESARIKKSKDKSADDKDNPDEILRHSSAVIST
ncbi:hypothetical protein AAG570_005293 [Ranatra chinensis]|uniref:Transcription cofactor vestigial-like protein 4 n=1 Tax=Ranatra chinensis TaxID=642074 RepID=A0ABD0YCQ6_9HEMI